MDYKRIKGTKDLLPEEIYKRRYLENVAEELFERFGYLPIKTPVFEQTDLFVRGIGEATEIVEKEMYTFEDRAERSLTLRPEGTAPIVRAYIENNVISLRNPTKLYYFLPMYRYEKPQRGRMREFYQIGLEVFGAPGPDIDAEVIFLLVDYFKKLGLEKFETKINTLGCKKCRGDYIASLKDEIGNKRSKLCDNCRVRLERNVLRVFDCKNPECRDILKGVSKITENVCENCSEHFSKVKKYLDKLNIKYVVDSSLVRGFDYYEKTTFEVITPLLGAQNAIGGGGRYDRLVKECGGQDTPGLGFAIGVERLLLQLKEEQIKLPGLPDLDVYVCVVGKELLSRAFKVTFELRNLGVSAEMDYAHRSLKTQFKAADKAGAKYAVIIAPDEDKKGVFKARNMKTGKEEEIKYENIHNIIDW